MKQSSKRVNPIDREQIEKVIAELGSLAAESEKKAKSEKKETKMYGYGRRDGLVRAANLLREVLSNEDANKAEVRSEENSRG